MSQDFEAGLLFIFEEVGASFMVPMVISSIEALLLAVVRDEE